MAAAIAGTLTLAGLTAAQAGQNGASKAASGSCADTEGPAALLTVDYRNGKLNSGIPDLTTTHASADDASYIVPSGTDHAVAHKVTLGDPAYVSDGAPAARVPRTTSTRGSSSWATSSGTSSACC